VAEIDNLRKGINVDVVAPSLARCKGIRGKITWGQCWHTATKIDAPWWSGQSGQPFW